MIVHHSDWHQVTVSEEPGCYGHCSACIRSAEPCGPEIDYQMVHGTNCKPELLTKEWDYPCSLAYALDMSSLGGDVLALEPGRYSIRHWVSGPHPNDYYPEEFDEGLDIVKINEVTE